jgi:predicted dehydrogenase
MLSLLTVTHGYVLPSVPSTAAARPRCSVVAADATCDIILVGAGVPKRGMGWYHAKQILDGDVPAASLSAVVEPWFLGPGADSPPGATFATWAEETGKGGVAFCKSVADAPPAKGGRMALISGRTADNPRLLKEVIEAGCTAVYLEKPGAPTVGELEEMREYAAGKGVPVYMGYNKNVCEYVSLALEQAKKAPGSVTTYVHNNAYTEAELPECFERNAEGMLKNMAIHELALLATYWGVTVDTIAKVEPDAAFSRCLTLTGPGGDEFTDFSKVGFTVTTLDGTTVKLQIDRCGDAGGTGNSIAIVSDAAGEEIFRAETPDDGLKGEAEKAAKADPEMMPYFFLQHDDYITLKQRTAQHVLEGKDGTPEGIATIDIAIDALKVAEYLTPLLTEALKK